MLTALPDAANDLTLPCHEKRAGAATERPANSRADLQTRIESRQLDEFHKCHRLHHSACAHTHSTRHNFSLKLDSVSCSSVEHSSTLILNIGVLHVKFQGQVTPISQGLSSRTVTSVSLISN